MTNRFIELFSMFGVFKEEIAALFFLGSIIFGTYIICKVIDFIQEEYEQWKWKNSKK